MIRLFVPVLLLTLLACGPYEALKQKQNEVAGRDEKVEKEVPGKKLEARKRDQSKSQDYLMVAGKVAAPAPHSTAAPVAMEEGIRQFNTEEYDRIYENEFKDARQNPLSTFSIDVDTASYANVRRFITGSQLPPKDAVRIEEMINYFSYDYPQPRGKHPFSITSEISTCPWAKEHKLIHIGLQGKSLDYDHLKPCNLVFLVDSSGSMSSENKLPLLKQSFKLLLDELDDRDRIAIVAYASAAGLVLPSTPASQKEEILTALDSLHAGGSTAGGAGIRLAYQAAKENLISGGNNRVILATDGDFNVGVSSTSELVRLIEEKRKDDIYLTILGFGMGNYKDGRMEQISNAGNGNYFYIDSIQEARKVFVREMRANLFTIAKDVKIQIEFNPALVKAYRLVGYENRVLANEDFNDDKKDAGELGAGHTVTALYEIIPAGADEEVRKTDGLKYQQYRLKNRAKSGEIMTVKLRYKPPKREKSILIEDTVTDSDAALERSSDNFRFSAAVAGFGMLLRDSKFKGDMTYERVISLAKGSTGKDSEGYRAEFIKLAETCALLSQ
jgi:Ca-activated chloride channel family protein